MGLNPEKPRRRSIRLDGYDYAEPGAYFVTVCTQGKECLFGEVVDGGMRLNPWGEIVWETWERLPCHYPSVESDAFVVMPNHVHGVIFLVGAGFKPARANDSPRNDTEAESRRAGFKPAPTIRRGLPEIVRALKTFSARRINENRETPGVRVWQRNYYKHVIRDDAEWNLVREYIAHNPECWGEDAENPNPKIKGALLPR